MKRIGHATCLIACMTGLELQAQGFINTYGDMLAQDGVGLLPSPNGYTVGVRTFLEGPPRHVTQVLACNANGSNATWEAVDGIAGNSFIQAYRGAYGNTFLAGSVIPPGGNTHDGLVIKRAPDGGILWVAQPEVYGDEQYIALQAEANGGAVAAGVRANGNGHDVWVTRFTPDGMVDWSTAVGSELDEEAYDLVVQGNMIMLTGRQVNFGGTTDAWFARLDLTGALIWTTSWGGAGNECGRALVSVGANAFIMAGSTTSLGPTDNTEQRRKERVYLMGINSDGDTLWTHSVGDTLYDQRAFDLAVADNTDLIICGERSDTRGESDALALRIGPTLSTVWGRVWDLGKEERLLSLVAFQDGFAAAGWAFTPLARQVLLIRRNADGN